MNKKEWFVVMLPLVLTWYLDRITKIWATELTAPLNFGWFHFTLHHNPGALLGLFADLPPVLRVVSLSTGGAFLVCTYVLIQYLLPIKSMVLRCGMSVLLGGILGNVTDRIVWGHVVDFLVFGGPDYATPVFNLADSLQWVGYLMILVAIIREGELLWPENNVRKQYWINPKFQLKYCYILLGLGLGISLITLVYSYTYMRVTMVSLIGTDQQILDKFLLPYFFTYLLVCTGICVGLFAVGKVISHKIAGPIYAFEKYTNELIAALDQEDSKTPRVFRLRSQDEFKSLEQLAIKLQDHLKSKSPNP